MEPIEGQIFYKKVLNFTHTLVLENNGKYSDLTKTDSHELDVAQVRDYWGKRTFWNLKKQCI